jgi:CRP-like cAMP-binding protein
MITFEKFLVLKGVQMFKHTPDDILLKMASVVKEVRVSANQEIVRKNEFGNSSYIIVEGRVKIHDEDRLIIEMGEREIFAELAALAPEKHIASVTALEDSLLFKISGEVLYELMNLHVGLARGIIEFLCFRVRQIAKQK